MVAIEITEKVYINGVEFEDISAAQISELLAEVREEMNELGRTFEKLAELSQRKLYELED